MTIGFHMQGNVDRWPPAAALLPDGAPMKFTDGGPQRAVESKGINNTLHTAVRHVVWDQGLRGNYHDLARKHFAGFVDETFRKHAWAVDAVFEWNEYLANSQTQEERNEWIKWARACVDVWGNEYRTQKEYAHINLIIGEAAVGNDIPPEFAKLSHEHRWVHLGYHGYVPVWMKEIRPDEWEWYSGRWESMDKRFANMGYRVTWYIGEFGAVGHNGPGWPNSLAPNDGWEHENVYNGDIEAYIDMMRYWLGKATQTAAWKEGRLIGATIFTSGGGSRWKHFDLLQPQMGRVAQAVADYMANIPPPYDPPPDDDDDWQQELWDTSIELQTISLNPNAALQSAIFRDGYVPVESEFWQTIDEIEYAAQAAEHLSTGARRVYYAIVPNWNIVKWFTPDSESFSLDSWPCMTQETTQLFGENVEYYQQIGLCCGHNGVDFGCVSGEPIFAAQDGVVERAEVDDSGYGLHVRIDHDDTYQTRYAHMLVLKVVKNQTVMAGDLIGHVDNTGFSTGPHLHFEIRKNGVAIDPLPYLEELTSNGSIV